MLKILMEAIKFSILYEVDKAIFPIDRSLLQTLDHEAILPQKFKYWSVENKMANTN